MVHPLLLQPEVLGEFPALLDDRSPRFVESAFEPSYRSEAFAEDLSGSPEPQGVGRSAAPLLSLAPLCVAVAGAAFAFLLGAP